jgi:hypothetical protein
MFSYSWEGLLKEYREPGIGLKVSVIGLGSNAFSRVADEITSILAFDDVLCVGVTFVWGRSSNQLYISKQGGENK